MNWLDLFASLLSKQQGQNWRGPFMRVHKSEKRREVTLQGFCWPFACCHSPSWHHFSTKARKLLWSPFDFLLGVPVFYLVLSRPIKNDTSPLAHWSHSRIKDSPYSLHHSAPDSQNLQQLEILTEVFSAQIPSEGAVIRPQDAHHLPEQTQKTTVWCSMEWANSTKADGCNLTNELEEVQRKWGQTQNSSKAKGQKGSHLCLCCKKWQPDLWKQKTTIPLK